MANIFPSYVIMFNLPEIPVAPEVNTLPTVQFTNFKTNDINARI